MSIGIKVCIPAETKESQWGVIYVQNRHRIVTQVQRETRQEAFTEIQGRKNWRFSNWIENVKMDCHK